MLKRFLIFVLAVSCATACLADTLWHCTATSSKGAVWNQYASTRDGSRSVVEDQCIPNNNHKECPVVCFPPRVYWRCFSHDTVPVVKNTKNTPQPKQGTWYWTSFSKQVAINGARDACRHNSGFGGCYVNPNTCASS